MSICFILSGLSFCGKGNEGENGDQVRRGRWRGTCQDTLGTVRGIWQQLLHALLLCVLRAVGAIKELPLEQLDGDDSKDEHEELVDNEYVEDVLQGGHHAIKHSLRTAAKDVSQSCDETLLTPRAEVEPRHHQAA